MSIQTQLIQSRNRHLKWRVLDPLELIMMVTSGVAMMGFSAAILLDVATRGLGTPLLQLQEIALHCFVYGVFVGAATATRRNEHLYLLEFSERFAGRRRRFVEVMIGIIMLAVCGSIVVYGYDLLLRGMTSLRPPSMTPVSTLYAPLVLFGALSALFTIERLVNGWRNGFEQSAKSEKTPS